MLHVFHHNKDKDGWCCAYLFHRFFYFYPQHKRKTDLFNPERKVSFNPFNYGNSIPEFKYQDIVFADISPTRQDAERLLRDGNKIIIIDHHKTAYETLKDLDIDYIFNNEHAACVLIWEALFSDPVPQLVLYIEDADLYKFALPNSKIVNEVIRSYADTNIEFDHLISISPNLNSPEIITEGEAIIRAKQQYITSALKTQHWVTLGTRRIAAICCAVPQLISELGNILAHEYGGIGAVYFVRADEQTEVSLRSEGDIDVSIIAKELGGGGHKNAAGFLSAERLK